MIFKPFDALAPLGDLALREAKPWESEPDYEMFAAAGLVCVVRRTPELGHLCGYVGVPRGHPLFEVDRTDFVPAPDTWETRPFDVDEHGIVDTFLAMVNRHAGEFFDGLAPLNMLIGVHGGLTWSDRMHDHTGWWFGFDCGHAGDLAPGLIETIEGAGRDASFLRDYSVYRTFDYVKQECATLAQQIADWQAAIPHIDLARQAIAAARATHHTGG